MERLSAQDLMMLWPEELGWSQDIGALAILDGRRLLDADGRFRIETARDEIAAKKAAGYYSPQEPAPHDLTDAVGRSLDKS